MAVFHAGGFHHGVLVDLGGDGLVDDQIPQNGDQLLRGDPAGAQQPGAVFRQIHDGGLHAHPAWAAVHDGGDFSVMVVEDVLGGGGGGLSGNVGGGSSDRNPARRMISRVTALSGQRTATVESPPVVRRGTQSRAGSTMVSGPGQNFFASS